MAWRCSGASNAELVGNLRSGGIMKSDSVAKVRYRRISTAAPAHGDGEGDGRHGSSKLRAQQASCLRRFTPVGSSMTAFSIRS